MGLYPSPVESDTDYCQDGTGLLNTLLELENWSIGGKPTHLVLEVISENVAQQ